MQPRKMVEVKGGLRYNTETATLLAGDDYWDGHNWERRGRNQFLFRTPNGRYFCQELTRWEREIDRLVPVDQGTAINIFESLPEKRFSFEEAFPGVEVPDA